MNHQAGTAISVTVRYREKTVTVEGRATGVPGLIANDDSGQWTLTHERSGFTLGWYTSDPEAIMAFARALEQFDWTVPVDMIDNTRLPVVKSAAAKFGLSNGMDPAPPEEIHDLGVTP